MAEEKVFTGGEFLITDAVPEDVFTPEDFTDEHKMIFETATDFVAKEIFPNIEALEEKNSWSCRCLEKRESWAFSARMFPKNTTAWGWTRSAQPS